MIQTIYFKFRFLFVGLVLAFSIFSCKEESTIPEAEPEPATSPLSILVEAESFTNSSSGITIQKGNEGMEFIQSPEGVSWASYTIEVPKAGRYKFEIQASATTENSSVWMEDYIDNKDGRTYNITGAISIPSTSESFSTATIDGSPLNAGSHHMKLHLNGNSIKVDMIKFTLIKAHQETPIAMTQKMDGEELVIVWADEFEGEGIPDTTKWLYDIGDWGWGNNELQYYTENRVENGRVEDGHLIIEARKDDMGHDWTSARLTTRGKVTFTYGRIEFRAKVPVEKGNWAAGWTLGDDYVDEISWPYCGEIDILETVGFEVDDETGDGKAHASIHCGAYYFKLGNQPTADIPVLNMSEAFHTYAIDWTPTGITTYVDGTPYFTYSDTSNDLSWPYNKPQNLILNLAMGGGWGGAEGMDETVTSQKYILDYVRVYEMR